MGLVNQIQFRTAEIETFHLQRDRQFPWQFVLLEITAEQDSEMVSRDCRTRLTGPTCPTKFAETLPVSPKGTTG